MWSWLTNLIWLVLQENLGKDSSFTAFWSPLIYNHGAWLNGFIHTCPPTSWWLLIFYFPKARLQFWPWSIWIDLSPLASYPEFMSQISTFPMLVHPPDTYFMSQDPISIGYFHLLRVLNRFPHLQSLSLCGCTELPDSGLSLLTDYGSKLQSLRLDCCFGISDHGLSYVAMGCPSLTDLSLYRCNITDVGLETLSESCSALKDVNLSYCSRISDDGIRALSRNCQLLRAINISHCKSINGTGFQGCSWALAYVEADSCKLEPEGIQAVFSGGGLDYLDISNLSWCIHGHGFTAIDTKFTSKLTVLNFRVCRYIDDDAIVNIARGCPLLQEWNLALLPWDQSGGVGVNWFLLLYLGTTACEPV